MDDLSYDTFIRLEVCAGIGQAQLWAYLTKQEPLSAWFEGSRFEARLGGRFEQLWRDADGSARRIAGRIEVFEPLDRLMLSWSDDDWGFDTYLSIELRNEGEKTRLFLVHSGWEFAPEDRRDQLIDDHIAGWSHHLSQLCADTEQVAGAKEQAGSQTCP